MSNPQQPDPNQPYQQQPNPQQPYPYQGQQPMNPSDERLYSTLIHIGGIFFSFIPALIGYLVLKDRGPFIREHSATALNFQITMAIAYVAGAILSLIVVGIFVMLAAALATIVFGILAAIAANNGQRYTYPVAIKFIS